MPSEQGLQHWWVWKASIVQGAQGRCWLLVTRRGRHRIHKASLVFSCTKHAFQTRASIQESKHQVSLPIFFAGQWVQAYGAPLKACLNTT